MQCKASSAKCAPNAAPDATKAGSDSAAHPTGRLLKERKGRHQIRISCPNPAPPDTPDPRKPRTGANATVNIHAIGIGGIHIGESVPDFVNEIEGGPYDADFIKATRNMDHYDAIAAGFYNMDGYPTIRLKNLDLVVTLAQDERVLYLSPGPQILTKKGTGVGSTLHELKQKYGVFWMSRIPEPYHCWVGARGEPRVGFLFTSCESACAGERAQEVTVVGSNYDFMEQKWGTPRRYPLDP